MIHELKTEAQFFEDVAAGYKPFEVRENDRQFKVGDFLALNEIAQTGATEMHGDDAVVATVPRWEYTGRCVLVLVTYILTDPRFVEDGYCVLGIRPARIGVAMPGDMYTERDPYRCETYSRETLPARETKGGRHDGDRA